MSATTPYEVRIREFASDATEAMLDGHVNIRALARRHNISLSEARELTEMVRHLESALVDVKPSTQFKRRLRADLIGAPPKGLLSRLRSLPPRLQIAAVVAIIAAMALLGRRRMAGEAARLLSQLRASSTEAPPPEAQVSMQ